MWLIFLHFFSTRIIMACRSQLNAQICWETNQTGSCVNSPSLVNVQWCIIINSDMRCLSMTIMTLKYHALTYKSITEYILTQYHSHFWQIIRSRRIVCGIAIWRTTVRWAVWRVSGPNGWWSSLYKSPYTPKLWPWFYKQLSMSSLQQLIVN